MIDRLNTIIECYRKESFGRMRHGSSGKFFVGKEMDSFVRSDIAFKFYIKYEQCEIVYLIFS